MRKNGFTLVELLAVLIILGVISALFIPNAIEIIDKNNLKIYKIKENELVKASEDYANFDSNFVKPTDSSESYITIEQLASGNYLNKILDSSSGNECKAFVKVTLNSIYGYDFEPCLICDEYKTNKSFCTLSNYGDL